MYHIKYLYICLPINIADEPWTHTHTAVHPSKYNKENHTQL